MKAKLNGTKIKVPSSPVRSIKLLGYHGDYVALNEVSLSFSRRILGPTEPENLLFEYQATKLQVR
jgi:hypothetical protein